MKKIFYFKKPVILILCFLLDGCREFNQNSKQYDYEEKDSSDAIAALAVGALAIYGGYRMGQIARKYEKETDNYYDNSEQYFVSCKQLNQNFQGCCSRHGGVAGCNSYYVICNDNTISRSCTCTVDRCLVY